MQTLTEQLVEALESTLTYLPTCGRTPPHRECGCWCVMSEIHRALDRARTDPEALLRENGEAVRRTGNELIVKRSPKTGSAT